MLKYLVILIGLMPNILLSAAFPALGKGKVSCDSLWIERNQIYNVAGQCFTTALGQAVFDNSDCVPGEAALSETALTRLSQILRAEERLNCAVPAEGDRITVNGRYGPLRFGAGAHTLGRWPLALQNLDVFPYAAGRTRSCTVSGLLESGDGFLALRSGPDVRYPQIGQLFNGDRVTSTSVCMGRWCFSDTVMLENRPERLNGWFHASWCRP